MVRIQDGRTQDTPVRRRAAIVAAALGAALTAAGCASTPAGSTATPAASVSVSHATPSSGPKTIAEPYAPTIDPSLFSITIDNPYFPLVPGNRLISEAATADGLQRTTTEVSRDTKTIMGVRTVAVHDTVTLDDKPFENTTDWYAQDRDGTVWYFGEATSEVQADGTTDTQGSFVAGVNGAQPGIVMPGHPQVGDQYRQEYAQGVAEDTGAILSLTGSETTPLTGPTKDMVVTKDLDALDPTGPIENKYYARGVGLVLTLQVTGPAQRDQATALEKF